MTDRTDSAARHIDGPSEPDAVPTPTGQRMPGAVNGQSEQEEVTTCGLRDAKESPLRLPGYDTEVGPEPADNLLPGGHGPESPDWPQEIPEFGRAERFFIWLSGARHQILTQCPTELPKYTGLGLTVLIPGLMAAVSMAFALVTALKTPLGVAPLFAVAWAAVIVSLDRTFVATLPRKGTWQAQLFRAVPRLLLSLLLGFVISTPFVLQIFRPEINNAVASINATERNQYYNNLPHNPVYLNVQKDQQEVQTLTTDAATGGSGVNPASDPTLQNLNKQLSTATSNESTAFANLQCQLYGTTLPGGHKCIAGNGPVANDDQASYTYWRGQVTTLTQQVQAREQVLASQNAATQEANKASYSAQLKTAKAALASAQQQLNLQTANVTSSINANTGILTQLRALSDATAGNSTLEMARLLLFALFVIIDLMPVMIKLMLNMSPENSYDTMLEAEEELQLRIAASRRAARLSAEEAQASAWQRIREERVRSWEAEQVQTDE